MALPNFNGLLAQSFAATAQVDTREFPIAAAILVQVPPNISVEFGVIMML